MEIKSYCHKEYYCFIQRNPRSRFECHRYLDVNYEYYTAPHTVYEWPLGRGRVR